MMSLDEQQKMYQTFTVFIAKYYKVQPHLYSDHLLKGAIC